MKNIYSRINNNLSFIKLTHILTLIRGHSTMTSTIWGGRPNEAFDVVGIGKMWTLGWEGSKNSEE